LGLVVYTGPGGPVERESGEAWFDSERLTGAEAMRRAGIAQLVPAPKEGLGMINGAQLTCAYAALAVSDAARLVLTAEIVAAMSIEALLGVTRAFHPGVHALRPYRGARSSAANLAALLAGSSLVDSVPDKVQDAYSLRCSPVVMGAVRDGVRFAAEQVGVEVNSVTDNPVILVDAEGENKAFSAGLFHGEPVGMACDHLKLCLVELGAIAERRVYRLTTGTLSARLPPALAELEGPGLGLMMPQVSAAALVAHNRQLAWPGSADTIPTCEDQEDHVAMSTTAARRAWEVLQNTRQVVCIELLAATRGVRARLASGEVALGAGTGAAYALLEPLIGGETPADDIAAVEQRVSSGALLAAVQGVVGGLEGVARGR
ncbi:MAG: aromatic amino acid lyase, partial [Myxococcales bacterium]|nr:aromatic amino acid lyase [Myxococcales bacterium]